MQSISLAIDGLPSEFTVMDQGGVYWFACDSTDQADRVAAGVLAGAGDVSLAVAVGLGRPPASMLALVADDAGPVRTVLYEATASESVPAARALPVDLARIAGVQGALCVVQLSAVVLDSFDDIHLADWSRALCTWASAGRHRVLLLCDGDVAMLAPRLLALNRLFSGVAQLYPHLGGLQYLIHYWSNAEGVVARREFRVERRDGRLRAMVADDRQMQAAMEEGEDRFLYLAQTEVLEGAPPFSSAWRLFEGWSTLAAQALQARSATVVLAVSSNGDVDALARLVYRLRHDRGRGLKLVVREMAPCLRYADERLLMQCGVNLVVPANTPLARFLTLLETVQGQRWQGELAGDPERLIRAQRPPDVGGIVSAAQFKQVVGDLLGRDGRVVESAVLALQPVAGVRAEQTLQQLTIRRRGDLACVYRGQVWLFLFACRRDGVERALGNLFRLSWREMFDGYRELAEYDVTTMSIGNEPAPDVTPAPVPPVAESPRQPRPQPRPLRLGDAR